jgi:hypothetical protein
MHFLHFLRNLWLVSYSIPMHVTYTYPNTNSNFDFAEKIVDEQLQGIISGRWTLVYYNTIG